jgi:Ca-activated chloride channel homolog
MWFAAVLAFQAVISVRTELVTVPVTVTSAQGAPVRDLHAGDFRVYENGRPQAIALFEQGETAVTLGLVVDRSGSTRDTAMALRAAVSALLQSRRAGDQLFAVGFNDDVSFARGGSPPFTNDTRAIEDALYDMPTGGRTALYDALAEALRHIEEQSAGRKVLVVVSDGGDNASRATYAQILSQARQSDTVIYAIGLTGSSRGHNDDADPGLLKRLCRDTGGAAYFPKSPVDAIAAVMRMTRDYRGQYTLAFSPDTRADAPEFRRITVKVSAEGHGRLRVRARHGYQTQP